MGQAKKKGLTAEERAAKALEEGRDKDYIKSSNAIIEQMKRMAFTHTTKVEKSMSVF
jgi:hypothetical protein